ncbi:MAG: glutathione S-transferase family protein [Gammaproteobacteria bacterium]|nr:glutathione S-transferase family protein [Gammaproteobacteria bacterium]
MKLLNSFGPNPRAVRMFALEKGLDLPTEDLDLLAGENRAEPYVKKNPGGQMPALELDDGTIIAETVVICEYLEELHPEPVLIGADALARSNTRMWLRRVELNVTEHMYNGFRYAEGIDIFRDRMVCIPEAADGLKTKAKAAREWLDGLIAGRDYVAGDAFTLADIVLYCCLDFCRGVGQPLEADLKNLSAWFVRIDGRDSAAAAMHPAAPELKMAG